MSASARWILAGEAPMPRRLPIVLLVAALCAGCAGIQRQPRGQPDKAGSGLLLSGAQGLPDLARGRAAAAAGRLADAERDLQPLAERGYPLAQTTLARLYAQAEGGADAARHWYRAALPRVPEADLPLARLLLRTGERWRMAEAQQLLRRAWEQRGEVEALTGLLDLYRSHPALDRQGEAARLAARAEQLPQAEALAASARWLRSTPTLPGHAERLVRLCQRARSQLPECYVDLARHERRAGSGDSQQQLVGQALADFTAQRLPAPTLGAMAKALLVESDGLEPADAPASSPGAAAADESAGTAGSCAQAPLAAAAESAAATAPAAQAQPELAGRIVQQLAAGDAAARVEAAAVVVRFPYLAPDFDAEAALQAGVQAQLPEAGLQLAQLYIEGRRGARDPQAALALLQAAQQQAPTQLRARYLLGRLYQYGYLDEIDATRALEQLLAAARAGYAPADAALARLFAAGRGVCPDYGAAHVFARLAAQAGHAGMAQLQRQLRERMDAAQADAADALFQQELAARGAADAANDGVHS